jgi:hypothetical protein
MTADMSSSGLSLPPPGVALEQLISLITPPGALVWEALPVELPWTAPPGDGLTKPSNAKVEAALQGAGVEHPAARWYILRGPHTEIMVNSPREQAQKIGYPARSIEVAVEYDIVGSDLVDLSRRLDLTDHHHAADARGARRYLSRGRGILTALGVWPWAHVVRWHPQHPWWKQDDVLRAVLVWHDRWWMQAAKQLARTQRARNANLSLRAMTREELEACHAFRESLDRAGPSRQ